MPLFKPKAFVSLPRPKKRAFNPGQGPIRVSQPESGVGTYMESGVRRTPIKRRNSHVHD
jgi:hypothetical protein